MMSRPLKVLPPGLFFNATVTLPVSDVTTFPKRSSTETAMLNGVLTLMLAGGWVVTTSCVARAGTTSKELVMLPLSSVATTWIVARWPLVSASIPRNVATPSMAFAWSEPLSVPWPGLFLNEMATVPVNDGTTFP